MQTIGRQTPASSPRASALPCGILLQTPLSLLSLLPTHLRGSPSRSLRLPLCLVCGKLSPAQATPRGYPPARSYSRLSLLVSPAPTDGTHPLRSSQPPLHTRADGGKSTCRRYGCTRRLCRSRPSRCPSSRRTPRAVAHRLTPC